MKDELQLKLVEILTSIQTAAGKASDFALEQLPDIAQSYVAYGRAVSTASSVLFLLIAIACFYIAWYAYKKPWNHSPWSFDKHLKRSDSNILVMLAGSFFGVMFGIISVHVFGWMVWFAPKAWLLKELATLIK